MNRYRRHPSYARAIRSGGSPDVATGVSSPIRSAPPPITRALICRAGRPVSNVISSTHAPRTGSVDATHDWLRMRWIERSGTYPPEPASRYGPDGAMADGFANAGRPGGTALAAGSASSHGRSFARRVSAITTVCSSGVVTPASPRARPPSSASAPAMTR